MPSFDPIPDYYMPGVTPKVTSSNPEHQSFASEAEAFYFWYQSIRRTTSPAEGYQGLQYIMQIGQQGTATVEEANSASRELNDLMEDLDGGKKTLDQIPYEVGKIVDRLTENNPKSRIVMQATKVEIVVNLSGLEAPDTFKEMMHALLEKVSPEMPNTQAEAINHTLQESLQERPLNVNDLKIRVFSLLK